MTHLKTIFLITVKITGEYMFDYNKTKTKIKCIRIDIKIVFNYDFYKAHDLATKIVKLSLFAYIIVLHIVL